MFFFSFVLFFLIGEAFKLLRHRPRLHPNGFLRGSGESARVYYERR